MADDRMAAIDRIFGRPLSPIEYEGWAGLVDQGLTPELVKAVYRQALTERRSMPAKYTLCYIRDSLAPYEVKTLADWEQLKQQQDQAAADRQRQWSKEKKPQNTVIKEYSTTKGAGHYDDIYKKF